MDFWRYVSEHECESPFLFLSMVRIIHSEHTRTCNLSEEIDKVNSRKDMIAYFSYDGFKFICEKNINKLIRLWRKDFRKRQPFIYIKHRVKKLLKKMRIV